MTTAGNTPTICSTTPGLRPDGRRALVATAAAAFLCAAQASAATVLLDNVQAHASARAGTLQSYEVDVAGTALASNPATITIQLPGRAATEATRSEFAGSDSHATWRGRTTAGHDVLLTMAGGSVRGRIYAGDSSYAITPDGAGGHVLSQLDPRALPNDRVVVPAIPYAEVPDAQAMAAASQAANGGSVATVDVMVAFGASTADSVGAQPQLDLFARAAIDQMNLVLENSQVDSFRVRLVKAVRVARSGSGNPETDLPQVRQDAEISVLRAAAGADVVMFIGDYTSGFNGSAYKNTRPVQYGAAFAGYAYGVVDRASVENSLAFAHEVGHILGMDHDVGSPHDLPSANSFPFAYGHVVPRTEPYAQGVLCVMAYQGSCGGTAACQQVPYLSNSNVAPAATPFEGRAIGVLDQAENYRVAQIVGPITADFMAKDDLLISNFE